MFLLLLKMVIFGSIIGITKYKGANIMRTGNLNGELQRTIQQQRGYMVVKGNTIIQKSRFALSAQQQKILLSMISKIKPEDKANQTYSFEIQEFCKLCNIDWSNGGNYDAIKQALYGIDRQIMWVKEPDKKRETRLRWLNELHISEGSGEIVFSFHQDMFPYLLDLREKYTQYSLINVLPMRSKYAIRLYELLKSYEGIRSITLALDTLKARLDAENYTKFKDFRCRVLERAVEEINKYTDIEIVCEPKKVNSRGYNAISFHIATPGVKKQVARDVETFKKLW